MYVCVFREQMVLEMFPSINAYCYLKMLFDELNIFCFK